MHASRVRALVQPGVRCLFGVATETLSVSSESRTSLLSSIERTAGVASPSGLSAIFGSYTAHSAFSSASAKTSRGGSTKDRRGDSHAKEEDPGLIRVVLRKDLKGLGRQGDVVHVKRGRMRHELYPAGDAAYATPENIAKYALTDAEKASRDSGGQEGVLEKLLKALARKSVIVTRRACLKDPERFVGPTVAPEDIRNAVHRQLGIQLDASHFLSEAEIKTFGTFKVPLNLRLPPPEDEQIELTVHVDRRGKEAQAQRAAAAAAAPAAPAAAGRPA
ncbi:hypothetical protein PLESTB_000104400 [Pleodorina starrii]|uniref:Large ribosomal subunit protein bL9c n=1 Tax=Pleodorina starrii TaxID=330485 RepID=A0A9W6BAE7_9CHLO|nr:hypothetical protein PLESTB_000104400 [Pleodorina starrii]GLC71816.1 hypothetical protein PLESTF_001170100 [Pleodorina starrii]